MTKTAMAKTRRVLLIMRMTASLQIPSPMCFAPGRCFPSWRASPTRRPDVLGVWELLESLLRSFPSSARTQMLSALTVTGETAASLQV